MNAQEIFKRLRSTENPGRARKIQGFFKTGPGEYAEGDVFFGQNVATLRKLAKEYQPLSLPETYNLLQSHIHEARFLALLLLIHAYKNGDTVIQEQVFQAYLQNTRFVNNWDLVDVSAEHIVGAHLLNRDRAILSYLATSDMLWERRISIIATFCFIKRGEYTETLLISEQLLQDNEDLIHKAVGWMLREVGKRSRDTEESFLKEHHNMMPRTMLRYAIERFPEQLRMQYLRGAV